MGRERNEAIALASSSADGEEAVELHDGEQVAHDRLDVKDDDLAAFGFHAALEAHEDGDARAREIVDLGEVDGEHRVRRESATSS